jgi:hypothetical protein
MQQGTEGTTISSSRKREVFTQQINVPGPGPALITGWIDAQNELAAFGTTVRLEVDGAVQIDTWTVRGAVQPGQPYNENIDPGPVVPGHAAELAAPAANEGIAPKYLAIEVTNTNGPTTVTVRVFVRDF